MDNNDEEGSQQMNLVIGTNGIMIESISSSAYLIFNPVKNMLELKSGSSTEKISLSVEGNIYATTEKIDVLHTVGQFKKELDEMKEKIAKLEEKLEEIYYAPEMPGYVKAHLDFSQNF